MCHKSDLFTPFPQTIWGGDMTVISPWWSTINLRMGFEHSAPPPQPPRAWPLVTQKQTHIDGNWPPASFGNKEVIIAK